MDHGPSHSQAAGARALRKITPTAPGEAARVAPRVRLPEAVAAALRRGDGDAGQAALRTAFVAQYSGDGEPVRRDPWVAACEMVVSSGYRFAMYSDRQVVASRCL